MEIKPVLISTKIHQLAVNYLQARDQLEVHVIYQEEHAILAQILQQEQILHALDAEDTA